MRWSLKAWAAAAALCAGAGAAVADYTDGVIKIGVLNDQSGLYSDLSGQGSVWAARKAVEDYCKANACATKIEVVFADHQNKPDVGSNVVRQWYDVDKVDVVVDVPTSSVALAVNTITKDKNKVFLVSGAASADLTGKACTPNTVHWTYDTWSLANGTANAIVKTGGDTWFFLTADYAFGASLEAEVSKVVTANAGTVVGSVKHPLNSADFSSFLLQAQSSKAKIIGLANAGGDTINAIKQAGEFGLVKGGQRVAALLIFPSDVQSLGLKVAQGPSFTETFYWDLNDGTRAFSKRFSERMKNKAQPSMVQAGVYSGLIHYFKTLDAMSGNPHDGAKVVAKMKELPTDDPLFGKGSIRVDGRKIHPAYLFEVKKPEESKAPWDYYKLIGTTPGDQAFRPLSESTCALVKK